MSANLILCARCGSNDVCVVKQGKGASFQCNQCSSMSDEIGFKIGTCSGPQLARGEGKWELNNVDLQLDEEKANQVLDRVVRIAKESPAD